MIRTFAFSFSPLSWSLAGTGLIRLEGTLGAYGTDKKPYNILQAISLKGPWLSKSKQLNKYAVNRLLLLTEMILCLDKLGKRNFIEFS